MNTDSRCFHCALPNPRDSEFSVEIDSELRSVCCPGCKAVAELIRDTGMSGYYTMRAAPQPGSVRPTNDADEWAAFDHDDMQQAFTSRDNDTSECVVYVGGMYCAACSWLIESTLARKRGVLSAEVNPLTHRLQVRWRTAETRFGKLLQSLADLGYKPQPVALGTRARPEITEQRIALKRLLVATLGMMQVTMFAVALYAGEFQGIDTEMQRFLRLVSLAVTTPVVFYSARPFFAAAWRGLKSRSPGMDLPVSIAVGIAYAASVYATFTDAPAVWFDSVTMFVFFLTLARFLEMRARHRSIDRSVALATSLPDTVTRIDDSGRRVIPASKLLRNDRVLVRAGSAIPADGRILCGDTLVDESLLTGESDPRRKSAGDAVVAGSINLDGIIEMRVENTGADTALGAISRLSERARYTRPAFVQLADRIASYIVVAILVIAALVAVYWNIYAPDRAFVITLSVLVVTCPCALALATPAAFAAAGARLSEFRLLVTNGNAIEALSKASHAVFDKTGTLTRGMPTIASTQIHDTAMTATQCREIAAALETASLHPIARAFATDSPPLLCTGQQVAVGQGVSGMIDGRRWLLGRREFVAPDVDVPGNDTAATTRVFLGTGGHIVAEFRLEDELRPAVAETLERISQLGLKVSLVSGDNAGAVQRVAADLRIADYAANRSPEEKLDLIHAAQDRGDVVIMIGDGINDAPVLAGANVSIAPSHGALLAQTSADVILLGDTLEPVAVGIRMARQTMRIVRQNLAWAIVYNATALPLAIAGLVPPWLAAIGMSASSLIVVMNSLRLSRYGEPMTRT